MNAQSGSATNTPAGEVTAAPTVPKGAKGARRRKKSAGKGSGLSTRARKVIGLTLTVVLAIACILVLTSYQRSFEGEFTPPTPEPSGVALVFVPSQMDADARTISGDLLAFLGPQLKDSEGKAKVDIAIEVLPSLTDTIVEVAEGQVASPTPLSLPAPGVVQRYPLDAYELDFVVRATSLSPDGSDDSNLTTDASVFFAVPGWSYETDTQAAASSTAAVSGTVVRAGSTKMVAVLMLVLMVALAVIAVMVVQSSAAGRMRLDLSVASWITAMLFALLPIRGFLPGDPPVGSWIDMLVFFWVEATIMLCVALTAIGLLVRARRQT